MNSRDKEYKQLLRSTLAWTGALAVVLLLYAWSWELVL